MRRLVLPIALTLLAACGDGAVDTTRPPPTTTSPVATTGPPSETTTTAAAPTTVPEDDVVVVAVTIDGGDVTVTVDGEPLVGRVSVGLGDTVRIDLISDVAEELHVHTYDLLVEAGPGAAGSVEFVADIPGIFEVERHFAGHVRIFDIQVG